SVLLLLAAAAWWWVTWPERTARQFIGCLAAREWDEANGMMIPVSPEEYPFFTPFSRLRDIEPDLADSLWPMSNLVGKPRSSADALWARGSYESPDKLRLEVIRGQVKSAEVNFDVIRTGNADRDIVESVWFRLTRNQ